MKKVILTSTIELEVSKTLYKRLQHESDKFLVVSTYCFPDNNRVVKSVDVYNKISAYTVLDPNGNPLFQESFETYKDAENALLNAIKGASMSDKKESWNRARKYLNSKIVEK